MLGTRSWPNPCGPLVVHVIDTKHSTPVRKQAAPPPLLARLPMLHNGCLHAGMYVASDAKPSAMSQQTCSMRELCIRLLALAVAGRAQQGHLQSQPVQDGQQPGQEQEQAQQQEGQQRRSLSPEVRVHVGVEAVAERLRESLVLAKRMASSKLLPKDLDSATQVRPSHGAVDRCVLAVAGLQGSPGCLDSAHTQCG